MAMPRTANTQSAPHGDSGQRSWHGHWLLELTLILLVALALRAYVVYRTPVIARDGMLYVGIARMINHGMWLDLVGDWFLFNPYPALIALLNRWGLDFDFAGQLVSALASSLAVVPLYLWCRNAFDSRIAQLSAVTYAFHPVLLRFSGQVLREGLYWCLMLWAVYTFWMAARSRSWWSFIAAGLLTTGAALTRMEGAVVFLLGALWAFSMQSASREIVPARFRWNWPINIPCCLRVGLSFAMFPLTIVILNLIFVPAGNGWHGCGRWTHFAARILTGKEVAPAPQKIPDRMVYIVADEHARAAQQQPPIDDVRKLAKSLPAWNPLGEPDPEVLRLQRFLILADDQRQYLIIGRFLNELWDGLLVVCVFCCGWGLYYGRNSVWSPHRDWPLTLIAVILCGLLIYHVATEFILEPRYMFCLIPFVFPWSAIGARTLYHQWNAWCAERPRWWARQLSAPTWCLILVVCAVTKMSLGIEDRSKLVQRDLGTRLRHMATKRLKIAGPESLKRVAHYAEADYFIIPRGDAEAARRWLDQQPLDLVILSPTDLPAETPASALLPEKSLRYRHWTPDEAQAGAIQIYSVQHKLKQVGS